MLMHVIYWGSAPWRQELMMEDRMGDKLSKEVVSDGDSLNLIPWGCLGQALYWHWLLKARAALGLG